MQYGERILSVGHGIKLYGHGIKLYYTCVQVPACTVDARHLLLLSVVCDIFKWEKQICSQDSMTESVLV